MTNKKEDQQEENVVNSETIEISRKDEAKRIVSKHVGWAAGTGAIPFPLWDVAAVGAVQIKMVKDLFNLYDASFSNAKIKTSLTILIGSLSPAMLVGVTASSLLKFVPGVGHVLASFTLPMLTSATSYAVGKVMISHLEGGGTMESFDAEAAKEQFKDAFEEGKAKVKAATGGKASTASA